MYPKQIIPLAIVNSLKGINTILLTNQIPLTDDWTLQKVNHKDLQLWESKKLSDYKV